MSYYPIQKPNGGYQIYYAINKPTKNGEVVFESASYAETHEELVAREIKRFEETDGAK